MDLNNFQKDFFKAIAKIQNTCVGVALCKKNIPMEELLYDVTSDIIIDIMTLIDGYGAINSKMDIVNKQTNQSMKESPCIELHDVVVDYIKQ